MGRILTTSRAWALVVVAGAATASVVVSGQAPPGSTSRQATPSRSVPRTADGHPDLQGMWNAATLTPLERPESLGTRKTVSAEEAAKVIAAEQRRVDALARASDPNRDAPPVGGDGSTGAAGNVGGYNYFWIDRGSRMLAIDGEYRSSIVVDPADGRVPALTREARERAATPGLVRPTSDARESQETGAPGAYDDVELRPLAERCLLGFGSTSGPPSLPNYFYNNLKQIVQTRDHVMILNEMVHDARIIPLNRTAHAPSHVRKWMGDSIGRWEGDTLVIETTNFTDKTRFRGSSDQLKVTERITRPDADTLLYRFTVEDPVTWTRPWSGEYTWVATDEILYEYACHEANYALEGILRGERLLDAERAQSKSGGAKKP